ncbi:MAG: rod shape-determining protein MreC [Oscillospiraceae bacterium]|nr:rod shape-determining protein MreC [Oscillospiraceae bacterium]
MKSFLKSTAFRALVIVVVLLALGSVLAGFLPSGTTPANAVVSALFSPLQQAASLAAKKLEVFQLSFQNAAALAEENKKLQEENEKIKQDLVDLDQAKQKIALYEEFYELKTQNEDFKPVVASVVGRAPDGGFATFTLGRGTAHGVRVGCPVVSGKNLVGTVTAAAANNCTVTTLLSPELSVGAYALNSSESLYVNTTKELAAEGLTRAPGLAKDSMLAPGSVVCTSGLSGLYPRGLIIGTVTELADNPETGYVQDAIIAPGAVINEIRDVFIITAFDGMSDAP